MVGLPVFRSHLKSKQFASFEPFKMQTVPDFQIPIVIHKHKYGSKIFKFTYKNWCSRKKTSDSIVVKANRKDSGKDLELSFTAKVLKNIL